MRPLRNGDLTDAAELIDSAQGCAKLLAKCCAEKDAEIARLREEAARRDRAYDALHHEVVNETANNAWLLEEIRGLYDSRKLLDGKDDWISISFDAAAWDRFAEIAREGR